MLCENEKSRVYLRDFTKDIILTEAINNPKLVILSPDTAHEIAVGLCSHSADVGIAASAGIFALVSFIQGLIAWLQG